MTVTEQVNILMVDDQPAKLLSYEAILGELGENLIKATSGRDALEQLLKTDIAIVLMDVSMPEIDGFELASMIRQHPRYQKTAIIFISAVRLTDLDRLKAYEVGAVDYIPVPVIPEILRAKVSVFAELYRKTRQLEGVNEELERRVEERTAALEESTAREREARLAAEAATQVRDDFLSVAAHELKTPVTGLRAISQLLLRRLEKRQITEYPWLTDGLATIDQQSDRLTRLIGQLLDVSRLDKDNQPVERSEIDLCGLAQKLVESFRARTTKHTLVLAAGGELIAEADPTGVEQVLSNLVENAIKYSPDGGMIEIAVARGDGGFALVSVRDHGIGIPPEKRGEIFDRFFRAHADDHRSGLGLGLYISRQIVALHGGEIAAEFPADGGTRFIVKLPVTARTLAPMPKG
jgi:signal transduction histidine kinase